MPIFEYLSEEIADKIANEKNMPDTYRFAFKDSDVVRRRNEVRDKASIWRPTFVHDIDKILHCPYYNRYTDKTQVFSLYKNDDITRRSLHVQLVSRIARTIGSALSLNLDLIEAIALGHDIGHPPFAHKGETYLNEIYFEHTGRIFAHSLQSVRVLDSIYPYNISLQTLNGIASHNGEIECEVYEPVPLNDFNAFDAIIERCMTNADCFSELIPSTLEAAVVRLSDIIAYLGKDRQDAVRANIVDENAFTKNDIGSINAEIINNLVVNVIENSYGKPYIMLDERHFKALQQSKRENYSKIYNNASSYLDGTIRPMMSEIYNQLLSDLKTGRASSPIFTHHINYVNAAHYERVVPYEASDPNQIVVDYISQV